MELADAATEMAALGCGMVHVPRRYERMERGIDGSRTGIQVKGAMIVHGHHVIFRLALWPFFRIGGVCFLQGDQPALIKGRKILPR